MKLLTLSTLAGDPLPLTLGAKVVKPTPAKPDLQAVPGKPHLFVNQQGRMSYAPPTPPKEGTAIVGNAKSAAPVDEWLDTPPPKPGWVCASRTAAKNKGAFRFWNGEHFSVVVYRDASPEKRAEAQRMKAPWQNIKWNPSVTVPWED